MSSKYFENVKKSLAIEIESASNSKLQIIKLKRALNAIDLLTDHASLEKAFKENDKSEILNQLNIQLKNTISAEIKEIIASHFEHQISLTKSNEKSKPKIAITLNNKLKKSPNSAPKNKPDLTKRIPKMINPQTDMYITSSGREATLVSPQSYKALQLLQKKQLESKDSTKRLINHFVSPPDLGLKYPVFIGEKGQMVAIMDGAKQKLGEGGFGIVFMGMDLESGKLVAVKFQNPKKKVSQRDDLSTKEKEAHIKNKKAEIKEENAKLTALNRLVDSIEHGDNIITVDELAWGKGYEKAIEPLLNDNSEVAVLKKMDMAIQFLLQIEKTHQEDKLIHRDIKLDNMLWDDETKTAKVIDFGFAIANKNKTVSDNIVGTPIYMSPEVLDGKYSIQTDAYACGVALIEIFSKENLFKHVAQWDEKFNLYLNSTPRDPTIITSYFEMAASDLFKGTPAEEIAPIVDMIKQLVTPNPKNRPSLSSAIALIKEQKHNLEYSLFLDSEAKAPSFAIAKSHIENPYIKKLLYYKLKENTDFEFLNKIKPESFFNLLKQAAIDNNAKVFIPLLQHFNVFEDKNRFYAQNILKSIVENAANAKNYDLIYTYFNQAEEAGKLTQTRIDLINIIKTYNIKLEINPNFQTVSLNTASQNEAEKANITHTQLIKDKESALARVKPLLALTDHQKLQENKTHNEHVVRTVDYAANMYKLQYGMSNEPGKKAEYATMVAGFLKLGSIIESTSQYSHNERKIDLNQVVAQWNKLNPDKVIDTNLQEQLLKAITLNSVDTYYDKLIFDANTKWDSALEYSGFSDIIAKMKSSGKYEHIEEHLALPMGTFINNNYPYPPVEGSRNQFVIDLVNEYTKLPPEKRNTELMDLIDTIEKINTIRVLRDKILYAQENFQADPETHEVTLTTILATVNQHIELLKSDISGKNDGVVQHLSNLQQELNKKSLPLNQEKLQTAIQNR